MATRLCARCRGRGFTKTASTPQRVCESCEGKGSRGDIRPSDLMVEAWDTHTDSYTMPGRFVHHHVMPEEFEAMVRKAGWVKVDGVDTEGLRRFKTELDEMGIAGLAYRAVVAVLAALEGETE